MQPSSFYSVSASAELGSTLDDLLISRSRSVVIITTIFFSIIAIILSGSATTRLMAQLFGLIIAFGAVSSLSYSLFERRYLLAHTLWQAGLAALILTAALVLKRPEILMLVALLPLIASITLGWRSGLVAGSIVAAFMLWPGMINLPQPMLWMIVLFGAFSGILGWVTTSNLMTSVEWSRFNFNQARINLEEAREQRVELQETQADLTKANQELARLAERLKVLQHVAEEARQAKAQFVANVSHELRTPLNMIIGFTEVITKSPQLYASHLPAALMTDIAAIQRNSQHLLALVNDVLDLSQVEAGQMVVSREWASVDEIIRSSMAVVQGLFDTKGLYLKLNSAETLPQVFCDQTRIRQVIINILSNAGRFTSQGGVQILCGTENDNLVIHISDTGQGIPEEDQKRIFEPFQQVDNSIRRTFGGSGLGLTISRQLITLHGGKMWLNSTPGKGTTISFSLPLNPSLNEEKVNLNQRIRRGLIPGDEYGFTLRTRPSKAPAPNLVPRLVVLEKEQSLQRLFTRYLPETEVVVTRTLEEAADMLNLSPAQALVVNLPPHENLAAQAISIAPIGTPVITCWIPGEVEAAKQLGVIQYMTKPITRDKLLAVLEGLSDHLGEGGKVKRVLVVDDEPDELHLFARLLESSPLGYQVLQASNGQRALAILRSRKTDIVLLDLMMPAMNGFQVLEEKRLDPAIRDIPVIVISSRDPLGEAITSDTIAISHNSGFSTRHLLSMIQSVTEIVNT